MKRRTASADRAGPLRELLVQGFAITHDEAERWVRAGAVYVDGRRALEPQVAVKANARLTAVVEERGRSVDSLGVPAAPLVVLFEDAELLVVDKPPGLTTQPTEGRVGESLVDLATAYLGHEAGLVHRLDRETSGLVVFGVTRASTSALAAEFREGRARKQYLAVTGAGLPPSGVIDLPLSRDPARKGRWRASRAANGLDALTRFTRLAELEAATVVALFPETGRTHQLRAHLAGLGYPIVGDTLYGGRPGGRCLLHARSLEILGHSFEAPVPADFPAWSASH